MRIEVLSLLAYRTQNLVLIWEDTGTSYGLTPFRSDFIDYVKCDIPVRDVTKVNTVTGIGTTLHNLFTDINGNPIYLPCVSLLDILSHLWREGYLSRQYILVCIALRNGIPK
jgi:hypothetical protein